MKSKLGKSREIPCHSINWEFKLFLVRESKDLVNNNTNLFLILPFSFPASIWMWSYFDETFAGSRKFKESRLALCTANTMFFSTFIPYKYHWGKNKLIWIPRSMVVPRFRRNIKSKFSINSNIQNLILPKQKLLYFLLLRHTSFSNIKYIQKDSGKEEETFSVHSEMTRG